MRERRSKRNQKRKECQKAFTSQSWKMNVIVEFAFKLRDIIPYYSMHQPPGIYLYIAFCYKRAIAPVSLGAPIRYHKTLLQKCHKIIHIATHYNFCAMHFKWDETEDRRPAAKRTKQPITGEESVSPICRCEATIFRVLSSTHEFSRSTTTAQCPRTATYNISNNIMNFKRG